MNKRVLVTGASRGIGLSIARALSKQDFELVLLTSRLETKVLLEKMQFVLETGATVFAVDQADQQEISAFANSYDKELWGIVNNAGICKTFSMTSAGVDPLNEILATNLIGPYLLTRSLLPYMSRPGRIVNISSQLGQDGREGYSAYCASKFGLIGMTKCWAKELGSEGITVNAICPGWVNTEMSINDIARMSLEKGMPKEQYYKEICGPLELKRFNSTEEVADLVAFLLSDSGAGITGRDWLMQSIWNQK